MSRPYEVQSLLDYLDSGIFDAFWYPRNRVQSGNDVENPLRKLSYVRDTASQDSNESACKESETTIMWDISKDSMSGRRM